MVGSDPVGSISSLPRRTRSAQPRTPSRPHPCIDWHGSRHSFYHSHTRPVVASPQTLNRVPPRLDWVGKTPATSGGAAAEMTEPPDTADRPLAVDPHTTTVIRSSDLDTHPGCVLCAGWLLRGLLFHHHLHSAALLLSATPAIIHACNDGSPCVSVGVSSPCVSPRFESPAGVCCFSTRRIGDYALIIQSDPQGGGTRFIDPIHGSRKLRRRYLLPRLAFNLRDALPPCQLLALNGLRSTQDNAGLFASA